MCDVKDGYGDDPTLRFRYNPDKFWEVRFRGGSGPLTIPKQGSLRRWR